MDGSFTTVSTSPGMSSVRTLKPRDIYGVRLPNDSFCLGPSFVQFPIPNPPLLSLARTPYCSMTPKILAAGTLEEHPSHLMNTLKSYGSMEGWLTSGGAIFAEVVGDGSDRILGLASLICIALKYRKLLFVSWDPQIYLTNEEGTDTWEESSQALSHLYDLSNTNQHSLTVRSLFSLRTLSCKRDVDSCANTDTAYSKVAFAGDVEIDEAVLTETLEGKSEGKNSVLLRVRGRLPIVSQKETRMTLANMGLAKDIEREVMRVSDLTHRQGLYVGNNLRSTSIHSLTRTLSVSNARRNGMELQIGATIATKNASAA